MTKNQERMLETVEKAASSVKWFIGVGIALFAILSGILIIGLNYIVTRGSENIRQLTKRYDPIFRNVLLDRAYRILSDVHITEIKTEVDLVRNIKEIKKSLNMVGAFDNRNAGLLKILDLLVSISQGDSSKLEEDFLKWDPLRDEGLQMTPQSAGFFTTFQGLIYLKKMREEENYKHYEQYLNAAKSKFYLAQKLNVGISNMWNGLGICFIEEIHFTGNLSLITKATNFFKIAYEIHRSPINLAAEINNLSVSMMTLAFYETVNVLASTEGGSLALTVKDKSKINKMKSLVYKELNSIERALHYDPNALSIYISKAEVLCNIAILESASKLKRGEQIICEPNNPNLETAMQVIREVRLKGFKEWSYLFSRIWISHTLLRVDSYRKEIVSYLGHSF